MRSATADMTYLLAARGLVFSNLTGFTAPPGGYEIRRPAFRTNATGDRAYWTAYDYFMEERELAAEERARKIEKIRTFLTNLVARLTRPGEGTQYTEHVAA